MCFQLLSSNAITDPCRSATYFERVLPLLDRQTPPGPPLKMPSLARILQASCDSYAFIVADDSGLIALDQRSESGASFPGSGASFEEPVMHMIRTEKRSIFIARDSSCKLTLRSRVIQRR